MTVRGRYRKRTGEPETETLRDKQEASNTCKSDSHQRGGRGRARDGKREGQKQKGEKETWTENESWRDRHGIREGRKGGR